MQAALHDPERGYYGRHIRTVGNRGDFATSASLSDLLGRSIAAWARHALCETRCRDLIEVGPGHGRLAQSVLASFPRFRRPRLHLVESSSPLREQQQTLLGKSVRWHSSLTDAIDACHGRACIYSNELVDAFPVRRFRKESEGWSEHYVLPEDSLWKPVSSLPDSSIFSIPHPSGQVVEVHQSYHLWLPHQLENWQAGRMLTIDYGAQAGDLYRRQPGGSLRAYFHHQCFTGPEALIRPGHQDLTADVNFTDLIQLAGNGFRSLQTQAEFLRPWADATSTDSFLIDTHGAGAAFLVLETQPA